MSSSSALASLDAVHQKLFHRGMAVMDANYRAPLLWDTAKLSTWYAAGLLARNEAGDVERAGKLLHNSLTQQYDDTNFVQNLHSFRDTMEVPLASGCDPLWISTIYDSYDPNNALFVTMGIMIIDSLFPDALPKELHQSLLEAAHRAVRGNIPRKQGWFGDDLSPSYTNPYLMRCVCAAYMGEKMGDKELIELSDKWTDETTTLWQQHDSPGEFNSPTYAGITLFALGLAQFCNQSSRIAQVAPPLMESTWRSLGETYNPSLLNVAGPWDRTYGYCMTRYYACIGSAIAAVLPDGAPLPIPPNLDGCSHYSDVALIPLQMLISKYVESSLKPEVKQRFIKTEPHNYSAKSDFHPYDRLPRDYSISLTEGLNVGGVDYDETRMGGPKGDVTQFVPGVIQWDSGNHGGGVGWIAVWPTTTSCKISATPTSLSISLPKHADAGSGASTINLHISCLPFFQLDTKSFSSNQQQLPGLTVNLKGNLAEKAKRTLRFDNMTVQHDAKYYELTFDFAGAFAASEVPELILDLEKTAPLEYPFVW